MSSTIARSMTVEEYLAAERASEVRSEFLGGVMTAMTGASRAHNLIVLNLGSELRGILKGGPCETYVNDMRVKVSPTGLYTYPDVVVVCGGAELEDEQLDTLLNPTVLFEVLSPTTEAYDRGEKAAHYRRIPSLQAYVLVAQARPSVERYERRDGSWLLTELTGLDESLALAPLGCSIPLRDVYDRVLG